MRAAVSMPVCFRVEPSLLKLLYLPYLGPCCVFYPGPSTHQLGTLVPKKIKGNSGIWDQSP